jgi:DNA-binding beta-propeller fold protein YncE
MKSFLLAVVVAMLPSVVHAEKVFKKATGNETWDCATDPVVRIRQDKGTFGLLGECKRVTVDGKKNVVTVVSTTKLAVSGTGNFIQVDDVSSIAVSGRSNQITWAKAKSGDKPKITKAKHNTVDQKK